MCTNKANPPKKIAGSWELKTAQTNPILKISPGGQNHFLQNKPNFKNQQNVLTSYPIN
jgi:hypothetical protein